MSALINPREETEIAIVGAGPGGCTAAAALAELGHEVLLIDKDPFPREKPCGDGLMHPAVAAAERMGLGDLIESGTEIESMRMMLGHRRPVTTPYTSAPGRPLPRCITRKEFDAGLLSVAQGHGARLIQARVDSVETGATEQRLRAVADGDSFDVRAGLVIAADGATSRLRRVVKATAEKPGAYAIRQYFRTERPIDPVFQIDVPLEVDGRILAAYGWVFPIEEYVANIGVGILCEPYRRVPSLRKALSIYVSELLTKGGRRFGDLEPLADPMGSPMGIRPRVEVSDSPGLALLGDAAGTTHPFSGEGIAFAMRGAEAIAKAVHARSKRGGRSQSPLTTVGDAEAWRGFPQIGTDTAVVIRTMALKVNMAPSATESAQGGGEPFLTAVWRLMSESAYETGVRATPAWAALSDCDPSLGSSLERANDLLLDRLTDRMPFVTEVIHESIRSHLGPLYAAVALAAASVDGTELPATTYEAGVSAEAVGILPKLFTMLVDRARSKQLKVNNALAVLAGDFAATRALTSAAKLGPEAVTALARACQSGCQGGMRDAITRFAADRSPENWLEAARETEGAAMVLATELGTIVRGEDIATAEPLREFGLELGVAMRLAEEIVDLVVGSHPGEEGEAIGRGIYSLPVLYAVEAEPSLPRLLAQHTAEQQGPAEIIAVVIESGALGRAISECAERTEAALSLADACGGGPALAALAALPAQYVSARVSGDALARS